MIKLFIENESNKTFKEKKLLAEIAQKIIANEAIKKVCEINLIIINNQKMQELCLQYKNQNKPTDVLSFANEWKELEMIIGYNMLGDIFISIDKIEAQALAYGHSQKRELAYLFAHGLLHLLGYDHQNATDESRMHQKIEVVLSTLGVKRYE